MTAVVEQLVQKVSSTRTFAKIAPYVVPAVDRAVHRITGGRVLLSTRMLPGCVLTSTGARSGLPRRTPLACMPCEETGAGRRAWVLIGSNFGRPGHPAWTANLLAHPEAEISWRGRDVPVRARLLRGAEREEVWAAVLRFWPPYARYQARVERQIRLFRLDERAGEGAQDTGGAEGGA
ncbi:MULTISPECIES: nitroreductase family deazaflavin-dependent oxidoreductase [Streptomyces]|uniref:Nitroreductase/quinone reductase family protein n=1 Tax=Streptomyces luteosporeus TaxID=173856 RepID=A0ABN3TQW5_9ACTN